MDGGHPLPERQPSDLLPRLISAAVLIPLALFVTWLGGIVATLAILVVALAVFLEWRRLVAADRRTGRPAAAGSALFDLAFVAGAVAIAAAAVAAGHGDPAWSFDAAVLFVVAGAGAVILVTRSEWLAKGVVLAGQLAFSLIALRRDPVLGIAAVVVLLVVVWATDSLAFLVGRTVGGPKLWPRVSPNKTWSGAVGGLVGGVAGGLIASAAFGVPISLRLAVVLAILSVASQGGDLYESSVKRRFGAKDAGRLIPGHGGILDRVDGLIFASLFAAFIGFIHAGTRTTELGSGLLLW